MGHRGPRVFRIDWGCVFGFVLALSGAGFLAAAVIYLVAFNWDDIGRFSQFELVAATLLGSTGFAAWRFPSIGAKASLFGAFLLSGAWLALFGQTYQTGVDPWQLFAGWSALTLGWAVVAQMPLLWAGQAAFWNVALTLWWEQLGVERGYDEVELFHALAGLNGAAWLGLEVAGRRWPALASRWLPRLLAGIGLAMITTMAMVDTAFQKDEVAVSVTALVVFFGAIRGVTVLRVGTDGFYFEEGTAADYENARYAEFRVDADGESVLVAMLDENLQVLVAPLLE